MNNQTVVVESRCIPIFALHNDTEKWAVILDDRLAMYDDCKRAKDIYAVIGGQNGNDGLADTPFGAAQIIAPNTYCASCWHDKHDLISGWAEIADAKAMEDYICRKWADWGVAIYLEEAAR